MPQNQSAIETAMKADLSRPKTECLLGEVLSVVAEADDALKHLSSWMAPVTVCNDAMLSSVLRFMAPRT